MPVEQLDDVWDSVSDHIGPALERSGTGNTLDDVKGYLEDERCMLWLVRNEAAEHVASLVLHLMPARKSLTVWLMGGSEMQDWSHDVQPLLTRYAQEHGMDRVEAYIRPGGARLLRPLGWRTRQVLIDLEVEHG